MSSFSLQSSTPLFSLSPISKSIWIERHVVHDELRTAKDLKLLTW